MSVSHGSRKRGEDLKKGAGRADKGAAEREDIEFETLPTCHRARSGTRRPFRHVSLRGSRSVRVARPPQRRNRNPPGRVANAFRHVHICGRPCCRHVRTLPWDASQPSRHMQDAEIRDASQTRRIAAERVASDTLFPKFETQRGFRQTLAAVFLPKSLDAFSAAQQPNWRS